MRTRETLGCVVLAFSAVLACADVGDLERIASSPRSGGLNANQRDFATASTDSGTTNRLATVVTLRSGKITISAAIDSRTADAAKPEVIRLDFTGRGKFKDAVEVPLKLQNTGGSSTHGTIGPATIEIPVNGQTIPAKVRGYYSKGRNWRHLGLQFGTALKGTCRFGEKVCDVRVVDGNGNLAVGDATTLRLQGNRIRNRDRRPGSFDMLTVNTSRGRSGPSRIQACYGQPVCVDGKWYEVTLSEDRKRISAREIQVATGKIQVNHDRWSMLLVGAKHVLKLSGGRTAISVPADRYAVARYREYAKADGKRSFGGVMRCGWNVLYGRQKVKPVSVEKGQVTELSVGTPLTACLSAVVRGSSVSLALVQTDVAGLKVDNVSLPGRGRANPPSFRILDEAGAQVHKGKLEGG